MNFTHPEETGESGWVRPQLQTVCPLGSGCLWNPLSPETVLFCCFAGPTFVSGCGRRDERDHMTTKKRRGCTPSGEVISRLVASILRGAARRADRTAAAAADVRVPKPRKYF